MYIAATNRTALIVHRRINTKLGPFSYSIVACSSEVTSLWRS